MTFEEWSSLKVGDIIYSKAGKAREILKFNNLCVTLKAIRPTKYGSKATVYSKNDRHFFSKTGSRMKNISIAHVYDGIFFKNDVQYKYEGFANTRLICHEVNDESKKIQFSCYDTIQVTDEQAVRIKNFLKDVIQRTKTSLYEYEESLKLLNEQNVQDE